MKIIIAFILMSYSASAFSGEPRLLKNALSCELKDNQLPSLMRELAILQPAFAKPSQQYGGPSADIYQLHEPIAALGYSSTEVVITSGRILLAAPEQPLIQVIKKLNLKEEAYSPASREIRPTVSIVALHMSHPALEGKTLIGCQYANNNAARWIKDSSFP